MLGRDRRHHCGESSLYVSLMIYKLIAVPLQLIFVLKKYTYSDVFAVTYLFFTPHSSKNNKNYQNVYAEQSFERGLTQLMYVCDILSKRFLFLVL